MNCRNGEKFLREAIDSIYAQTFHDWEIIFWDNLSTDKSAEIAKSYDSRMKYYHASEFLPVGASRNKAMQKAAGEFVAFLDTDDIFLPNHLEDLLKSFGPETAVVYANFTIRDMTNGKEYVPFDASREFHSGSISKHLCKKNFIWLQAMVAKMEYVRKLEETFDTALLTTEDFDFILRLSLVGGFNFVSEPTTIYRVHESSLTSRKRHYFAHDYSYLLVKYKDILDRSSLKDLARQYLLTVRLDLQAAGFKRFPFFLLWLSPRQIAVSLVFSLFGGSDIWEIKEKLLRPLRFFDKLLGKK